MFQEYSPDYSLVVNTPNGFGNGEGHMTELALEMLPDSVNALAPTISSNLAKESPLTPQ